jgi:hypothetical protein
MKNYAIKGQINLIKKRITKEEFYNRLPEKFKINMLKNKFNICDTTIRTRIKELVLEKKLAIGKNFTYSKISPTKEIIKHDKYTIFVFKTSDINEVNEFVKTLI